MKEVAAVLAGALASLSVAADESKARIPEAQLDAAFMQADKGKDDRQAGIERAGQSVGRERLPRRVRLVDRQGQRR